MAFLIKANPFEFDSSEERRQFYREEQAILGKGSNPPYWRLNIYSDLNLTFEQKFAKVNEGLRIRAERREINRAKRLERELRRNARIASAVQAYAPIGFDSLISKTDSIHARALGISLA